MLPSLMDDGTRNIYDKKAKGINPHSLNPALAYRGIKLSFSWEIKSIIAITIILIIINVNFCQTYDFDTNSALKFWT